MGLHRNFTLLTNTEDNYWYVRKWLGQDNGRDMEEEDWAYQLFSKRFLEDVSWYDFKEDMLKVSKEFPDYEIVIEVEEGSGELWRLFCVQGEVTEVHSSLVWGEGPFTFVY